MFILLSLFVFSSCQTTQSGDGKFIDVQFYSNCSIPKNSITKIKENGEEFRRFKLKNGQKGGCPSDRKVRHAAPYWERVELRQNAYLHKGSVYEIKFKVRFVEGFNRSRENFFQIHQYNKGCPRGPLIMLKFSDGTMYGLWTLKMSDVLGKWMDFNIVLDLVNGGYTLKINDRMFFENSVLRYDFKGCGKPHIKFGIYRPGDDKIPNNTSIVDFSKFQMRKVKTENNPYN